MNISLFLKIIGIIIVIYLIIVFYVYSKQRSLLYVPNIDNYDDSVGKKEEIKNIMARETDSNGNKIFTLASGISLLLFYAFAMQCMSTLAVVKKETNSWKWPILQFIIMTALAYFISLISFQILS